MPDARLVINRERPRRLPTHGSGLETPKDDRERGKEVVINRYRLPQRRLVDNCHSLKFIAWRLNMKRLPYVLASLVVLVMTSACLGSANGGGWIGSADGLPKDKATFGFHYDCNTAN